MRKQPQQQRSRLLVESILDAAALELDEHGLEAFSTASVAKRAGVSRGSLYQYFENSDALLDALAERLSDELVRVCIQDMGDKIHLPLPELARAVLNAALRYFDERPRLVSELLHARDQRRVLRGIDALESHFLDLLRHYAVLHNKDWPVDDLPATSFVLFSSGIAVVYRLQSVQQPGLSRERVIDALVDMFVAWFEKQSSLIASI